MYQCFEIPMIIGCLLLFRLRRGQASEKEKVLACDITSGSVNYRIEQMKLGGQAYKSQLRGNLCEHSKILKA
ncbi:hypothetical protein V1507DRAFT_469996 [Lipomyces tetrasporus]